jgi:hypothetical protein
LVASYEGANQSWRVEINKLMESFAVKRM